MQVLDSSSSISDILLNPFGDQMSDRKASSTTTRDIVGDGNSRDKSSDHKLSLLETIIQSTYVYLHSGNANIRDVNQVASIYCIYCTYCSECVNIACKLL